MACRQAGSSLRPAGTGPLSCDERLAAARSARPGLHLGVPGIMLGAMSGDGKSRRPGAAAAGDRAAAGAAGRRWRSLKALVYELYLAGRDADAG